MSARMASAGYTHEPDAVVLGASCDRDALAFKVATSLPPIAVKTRNSRVDRAVQVPLVSRASILGSSAFFWFPSVPVQPDVAHMQRVGPGIILHSVINFAR